MTSPITGLTLPNAQWRLLSAHEEAAVLTLRPQALLILGYPDSPVLVEKIAQEARLWEALGRPKVLLRPYAPDIAERDPKHWGRVCVYLWRAYSSYGIRAELILANELNREGMGNDWPRMEDWLVTAAEEVFQREPGIRQHRPALSPGILGYQEGWEYLAGSQGILDWFVIDDVHCYTEAQIQEVGTLRHLFGHPIVCTEINSMPPSLYVPRLAQAGCWESYWFILRWVDPEPGAPNVDLIGSPYFEDFKAMTHGSIPAQPLPPPSNDLEKEETMNKREAILRDMWERQGVKPPANGDNAFWDYAREAALSNGRAIIPQPSQDGNFENHDSPTFIIAYTLPPLYAVKGEWQVKEGLPPL